MLVNKATPELLREKYHNEKKSLSDIAIELGCSSQYVLKLLKKYNIPTRNKVQARRLKNKYYINDSFFSQWSPEMSYVLGLLFTDGTVQIDKDGKPTHISLSLNDLSLLQKVRDMLKSNHNIYKMRQKGLYCLRFAREKILRELNRLGMIPNKSKIIQFPDVPNEYLRHFIRGCWDGDGSVFFQYKKKLLMTFYVSGSKNFIEKMEDVLNKNAGLTKRKIYSRPSGTSFYFKYGHQDSIKLYHYMYDGVADHIFLDRKYEKFIEGIYGAKST